jgi:hypothetical protein
MLDMIADILKKRIEKNGLDSLHKFELHALYAHELVKDGCEEEHTRGIMRDMTQTEFIKQQLKETFGYVNKRTND